MRWQAPQPCRRSPGGGALPGSASESRPYVDPYARGSPTRPLVVGSPLAMPTWGSAADIALTRLPEGLVRACRKVRLPRLLLRQAHVLCGPKARAAYGGCLNLKWSLLNVNSTEGAIYARLCGSAMPIRPLHRSHRLLWPGVGRVCARRRHIQCQIEVMSPKLHRASFRCPL
jgi:hypothetical protein